MRMDALSPASPGTVYRRRSRPTRRNSVLREVDDYEYKDCAAEKYLSSHDLNGEGQAANEDDVEKDVPGKKNFIRAMMIRQFFSVPGNVLECFTGRFERGKYKSSADENQKKWREPLLSSCASPFLLMHRRWRLILYGLYRLDRQDAEQGITQDFS
jgi:hypothetical protein